MSSFQFHWDPSGQPTGKVFARKRKASAGSGNINIGQDKKLQTKDTTESKGVKNEGVKKTEPSFRKNYKSEVNSGNNNIQKNNEPNKNILNKNQFKNTETNKDNFNKIKDANKSNSNNLKKDNFNNNKEDFNKNNNNKFKKNESNKHTFNNNNKDNFNKFKKKDNFNNANEKGDFNTTEGNIKRKHKKDKALAQESGGVDVHAGNKNNQKNYSLFNVRHKEVHLNTSTGVSVSEEVFSGDCFTDLNIHRHLVSNLEKIGFKKLTNVQKKAVPVVMSGENSLIRSQTGSGKTLAYALPIIDALQGINPRLKRTDGVQAIVVVPTRELALQTHELFSKINTFQWVVVGHLCGGENRKSEKDRIRKGLNVLIGTPGRLLDHVLHTAALKVDKVRCLVLDEADRLLDMGFRKDIISLVEVLDKAKSDSDYDPMSMVKQNHKTVFTETEDSTGSESLPPLKDPNSKKRQTILLSATLNSGVSELAEFTMKSHTYIDALDETANEGFVIPATVKQSFILTHVKHRLFTLAALLIAQSKKSKSKIFVFMASTQMVEYHHGLFSKYLVHMPVNRGKTKIGNVALVASESDSEEEEEEEVALDLEFFKLHGNMDQKARKEVFNSFRSATRGVLICTDVAARGLDVPEADCIIQYTGPQSDEDYLHRVGRTGRAGKSGTAIIFLTHEEAEYVNHLRDLKVFLKERATEQYMKHLCDLMEEPDSEMAATALQRRFETALSKDKELHKTACFAYSSWSRFYSALPAKMRDYFNFKTLNLGHYVTSFGLKETPTTISKVIRGEVANVETPRLNKKLANHKIEDDPKAAGAIKKKKRSVHLMTSEFDSGLEPVKKKKKKQEDDE